MIAIPNEHFSSIKEKLIEAPTFVHSVLDLVIDGTVYADSTNYESYLIQTSFGLYYVTGNSSNERFLENISRIFEQAVFQGKRFTLFSNEDSWNQSIEKYLHNVRKIERYSFSFDLLTYQNKKKSNLYEYEIFKINQELINKSIEFNNNYYKEYWGSTENFLHNGIGFCVKDGDKIISEGVSIFKSDNYAEIDIMTDSNYRGKGLASIVAEQFIKECLSKKIQPRWDCDVDNEGSIKLGNKLGFTNPQKYAIYVKR